MSGTRSSGASKDFSWSCFKRNSESPWLRSRPCLALDSFVGRGVAGGVAILLTFFATQCCLTRTTPDRGEHVRFTQGRIRRHAALLFILSWLGEMAGVALLFFPDDQVAWIVIGVVGGCIGAVFSVGSVWGRALRAAVTKSPAPGPGATVVRRPVDVRVSAGERWLDAPGHLKRARWVRPRSSGLQRRLQHTRAIPHVERPVRMHCFQKRGLGQSQMPLPRAVRRVGPPKRSSPASRPSSRCGLRPSSVNDRATPAA